MRKALISLMLFAVGLLWWQCAEEKPESLSPPMQLEIARLSATESGPATGLAYINFVKIRQSVFYEMISDSLDQHIENHPEFQKIAEATGFDFRKDLHELYIAFDSRDYQEQQRSLIFVAIGRYDPDRILAYLAEKAVDHQITARETLEDFTLYYLDQREFVFCFADEQYLVGGRENLVKSWLSHFRKDVDNLTLERALKERLAQVKYKNGTWVVLNTENLANRVLDEIDDPGDAKRLEALRAVKHVQFSANVNNVIRFEGEGKFSDEEKAGLFHDAIKGLLATIKLSVSGDREAVDIINKVKVKTDEDKVRIDGVMTQKDIDKLLARRRTLAVK